MDYRWLGFTGRDLYRPDLDLTASNEESRDGLLPQATSEVLFSVVNRAGGTNEHINTIRRTPFKRLMQTLSPIPKHLG